MRCKSLKTNSAFTLMEVLVALVILALVGVVLVQVTSQATNQAGYLKRKMVAIWVAQDRITQLKYLTSRKQTVDLGDQETEQANLLFRTEGEIIQTIDGVITIEVLVYQPPSEATSIYRLRGYFSASNGRVRDE